MSEILSNYSVYVVAEILALMNIKLKHVIDNGVAFPVDMIAEKADQLVLMCKKAAQLDGRKKLRLSRSKDMVGVTIAYMRSEFGNVGLRIEKMRKRKRDCARMYLIKAYKLEDVHRLTIDNIGLLRSRNIEMPSRSPGVAHARNSDDVPILSPDIEIVSTIGHEGT